MATITQNIYNQIGGERLYNMLDNEAIRIANSSVLNDEQKEERILEVLDNVKELTKLIVQNNI